MLLYQSLIVYSLFALILYDFSMRAVVMTNNLSIGKSKTGHLPMKYWFCIFIFAAISGIRWDVGVDFPSYYSGYQQMLEGKYMARERGIESGFLFISQMFADFKLSPIFYFAFFAFFQLYFIIQALKDKREIVPYAMLVIILGGYYFNLMSGIRQELVACSFLWASKFIDQKKLIKYLIWVAIASTMHKSVVLLVPFYILAYSPKLWVHKSLNIIILIVCLILGSNAVWIHSLSNIDSVTSLMGYDNYIEDLTDQSEYKSFAFGPRMLINLTTYVLCIWYYPQIRTYAKSPILDVWFKFFFIGVCAYYLFVNTSMIFLRPVEYFLIFAIPIISYTLFYLKRNSNIAFIVFATICLSYTFISCIIESRLPSDMGHLQLFQFCFNQY